MGLTFEALLTAAVPALFRDPYFDPGCLANCTVNVFLACPERRCARFGGVRHPVQIRPRRS